MIYFARVGEDGPIKIGKTVRLGERFRCLRREFGDSVHLLGVIDGLRGDAQELYARFPRTAPPKVYANPIGWFEPTPELLAFIAEHARPWDPTQDTPRTCTKKMPTGLPDDVDLRPIEGFPNYLIGRDGSVWSPGVGGWRKLVYRINLDGYPSVILRRDGQSIPRRPHRLVLETFVGECPDGMECCHNDGNPVNCRVENLRWDTRKNNHADKKRHGTQPMGSRMHNARLNEEQAAEARRLCRDTGASVGQLAARFGVSRGAMEALIAGRTWRHVII